MKNFSFIIFNLLIGFHIASLGAQSGVSNLKNKTPASRDEFSTLGDNDEVMKKVERMNSQQRVRIVQKRLVDRNLRAELGLNYAFQSGGDSYVSSQNVGAYLEFHINPHWSIGGHYQKYYNKLTSEGERVFNKALTQASIDPTSASAPELDYALNSQYLSLTYYPIYGKLNLFDLRVAQFDIYTQLGYGSINLYTGSSNLYSLGLGVGLWLSEYFTTRFEVKYQTYKDLVTTEQRTQNQIQALAQIGLFLW